MKMNSKSRIAIESILIVPIAAIVSMYAAIIGASAIGHGDGSWGWGYMLSVPGDLVIGFILILIAPANPKQNNRLRFFPVLSYALIASVAVFAICFVFHGIIKLVFQC